jgi:hypothetical protein
LGPLFRPTAPFQIVNRIRVVLCPASRVRGAFLTRAQPDALPHAATTRRGLHLPPNSSPSPQPAVASCIRQRIEPMVHPPHARQTRRSQYAATTRRRLTFPKSMAFAAARRCVIHTAACRPRSLAFATREGFEGWERVSQAEADRRPLELAGHMGGCVTKRVALWRMRGAVVPQHGSSMRPAYGAHRERATAPGAGEGLKGVART